MFPVLAKLALTCCLAIIHPPRPPKAMKERAKERIDSGLTPSLEAAKNAVLLCSKRPNELRLRARERAIRIYRGGASEAAVTTLWTQKEAARRRCAEAEATKNRGQDKKARRPFLLLLYYTHRGTSAYTTVLVALRPNADPGWDI